MNEYKPNISINNEIITLNETMPQSDDPLIQLYIDSQKQKVYKTEENKPIKKRDKLYFASLGAKLGEESAKRIGKIRERYKNKQTN